MSYAVGNGLETLGIQVFGSLWAFAIFLIVLMFILLLLAGLNPMVTLLIIVPMIYAFGRGGWIPGWISYSTFVILVAWAGYVFYQRFFKEY